MDRIIKNKAKGRNAKTEEEKERFTYLEHSFSRLFR